MQKTFSVVAYYNNLNFNTPQYYPSCYNINMYKDIVRFNFKVKKLKKTSLKMNI